MSSTDDTTFIERSPFNGSGDPLTLIVNPESNDSDARRIIARLEAMGCDVMKTHEASRSAEQVVYTIDPEAGETDQF